MKLRRRLGVGAGAERAVVRLMQFSLVGMFFIGLDRGNTGIVVNAGIALAITELPALLERDYGIPMDAALTLWIASAVFFHALGTVGLPGAGISFYQSVWWWDHFTHLLSSSVVAGAGYAAVRSIDLHSDENHFPPRFTFVFILLFVVAFGVLWEVIEFAVGGLGDLLGDEAVLTQYGLEDTMMDLIFDVAGGVVTGIWGTARLGGVVGALTNRLNARDPE